ncbi:unnamed protein product [Lepeophtheirus salmonis]|uniref:(salmon louse) hypothetical protein n=1 Tax=Lepeophtheirus salmonis TaxID=72036 RepID=A0A7R8D0A4_LEPSM|nr:unnamed protein product [Lepeophtheirus salmonis]CAF2941823.1 unnamed protein product [Lepeophtheirus salmonis]
MVSSTSTKINGSSPDSSATPLPSNDILVLRTRAPCLSLGEITFTLIEVLRTRAPCSFPVNWDPLYEWIESGTLNLETHPEMKVLTTVSASVSLIGRASIHIVALFVTSGSLMKNLHG